MNNETQEILDRIDKTLKLGKTEIIFRKYELESVAKKSVIDWLENLDVITGGICDPIGNNPNIGLSNWPAGPAPRKHKLPDDPDLIPYTIEENDKKHKEWIENSFKQQEVELDKIDYRIFYNINKEKFWKIYKQKDKLPNEYNFWFDEKTFKLKIADGTVKSINLSTTKKQGTAPYFLMFSLIEILKKKGLTENDWLIARISEKEIISEVSTQMNHMITDPNWLKNTKANLKRNIPSDINDYIEYSDYKRKEDYFTFGLKMPA